MKTLSASKRNEKRGNIIENHIEFSWDSVDLIAANPERKKGVYSFTNCSIGSFEARSPIPDGPVGVILSFTNCVLGLLDLTNISISNFELKLNNCVVKTISSNPKLDTLYIRNCLFLDEVRLENIPKIDLNYAMSVELSEFVYNNLPDLSKYNTPDRSAFFFISNPKELLLKGNLNDTKKKTYCPQFSYQGAKIIPAGLSIVNQFNGNSSKHKIDISNAFVNRIEFQGDADIEIEVSSIYVRNMSFFDFRNNKKSKFVGVECNTMVGIRSSLEFHNSSLDNFNLELFNFGSFPLLNFNKTTLGNCVLRSCQFPDKLKNFRKIIICPITVGHHKSKNDGLIRYYLFLEFKAKMEESGNRYEVLRLQAAANDALYNVENLSTSDTVILFLNGFTNKHGLSLGRPFCLFFASGALFYIMYLYSHDMLYWSFEIDWHLVWNYFSFIDVTHKKDFLVSKSMLQSCSIPIDFVGKLFGGYFIYQFIAVFRKYGKK